LMKTALVVEGEIFADPGFRLAAVGAALQIDVLIFQRAQTRSMKTLSIRRPRPSIEMRTPASSNAPVKAAAVNWLPGQCCKSPAELVEALPYLARASSSAARQNEPSIVLESRQERTARLAQSMTATR
jgi:hypothetical protein